MWSEKYNPMVCFDALYSTSEGQSLENLENLECCSGSRIALPGGGYIDLPGIESSTEELERMFPSERSQTTEQLGSISGSRIALPGGGYIDLPGVESPPEQDKHMNPSDILNYDSGSRIELPGGGFIDLPGVESPPEQDEQMYSSDNFYNNSGSRIELPGGGFINLPGLESPSEQDEQTFSSDVFQDYGLLEESRAVSQQEQVTNLFTSLQSLEIKLGQKDQIIVQQERENIRLREHLDRFMQIVADRNLELNNVRLEASGMIRELRAWGTRLERRNKCLREEVDKKDSTIASLISEACSVPLLRRLLERGRNERKNLLEKLHAMEKSAQDLMTKNSVLEHELTVIPKEIMSKSDSKIFTQAEVHTQGTCRVSNEPPRANIADQGCTNTVSEQKTCSASNEDDPEQILVLQSQSVPESKNKENLLKKAKKVLTLAKWRRNEALKQQNQLNTDSLKRIN